MITLHLCNCLAQRQVAAVVMFWLLLYLNWPHSILTT